MLVLQLYARRLAHTPPQTLTGAVSQMCAGLTHYVSPSRLRSIRLAVPKVTLVTGDEDWMVHPSGSERIWEAMVDAAAGEGVTKLKEFDGVVGNVELLKWERTGHPLHVQWPARFNALLERAFMEGNEAAFTGV
jgi:hypothetical protein